MKGISTIIAAIILVVITIGLIATAYLYFAGIVSVGAVVSISSANCAKDTTSGTYNVSVVLKNEGTADWSDLTFLWDGEEVDPDPAFADCEAITAGETDVCILHNGTYASGTPIPDENIVGTHTISVIGPRNQAGGPITC